MQIFSIAADEYLSKKQLGIHFTASTGIRRAHNIQLLLSEKESLKRGHLVIIACAIMLFSTSKNFSARIDFRNKDKNNKDDMFKLLQNEYNITDAQCKKALARLEKEQPDFTTLKNKLDKILFAHGSSASLFSPPRQGYNQEAGLGVEMKPR